MKTIGIAETFAMEDFFIHIVDVKHTMDFFFFDSLKEAKEWTKLVDDELTKYTPWSWPSTKDTSSKSIDYRKGKEYMLAKSCTIIYLIPANELISFKPYSKFRIFSDSIQKV